MSVNNRGLHSSVVVTVGSTISAWCAAINRDSLFWEYYPYKSSTPTTIYNGGKPVYDLDPRFVLKGCQANNCSLEINGLQLTDAGRLVCLGSPSANRYLWITILGRYYICGENDNEPLTIVTIETRSDECTNSTSVKKPLIRL